MLIFPAIDLKDGRVVRLKQGDFLKETIYHQHPVKQAKNFFDQGAEWLHLVDLDRAKDGRQNNSQIIKQIKEESSLKIQLGGGIRSMEQLTAWVSLGIDRLVIGTLALEEPQLIEKAVKIYGSEKIVISIDAKDGYLATHGWLKASEKKVLDFALEMRGLGVQHLLYTDIRRDGMLTGPDLKTVKLLTAIEGCQIIASGGISSLNDLFDLQNLGVQGVVIGEALYKRKLTISKILEKLGEGRC